MSITEDGRDRDGRRHCLWCGLAGHRRAACWIRREGRRQPDDADRLVASIVARYSTTASDLGAIRGELAAALRIAACTGRVPESASARVLPSHLAHWIDPTAEGA